MPLPSNSFKYSSSSFICLFTIEWKVHFHSRVASITAFLSSVYLFTSLWEYFVFGIGRSCDPLNEWQWGSRRGFCTITWCLRRWNNSSSCVLLSSRDKSHGYIIKEEMLCGVQPLDKRGQHGGGRPLRKRLTSIHCIFITCLVLAHGPRNRP